MHRAHMFRDARSEIRVGCEFLKFSSLCSLVSSSGPTYSYTHFTRCSLSLTTDARPLHRTCNIHGNAQPSNRSPSSSAPGIRRRARTRAEEVHVDDARSPHVLEYDQDMHMHVPHTLASISPRSRTAGCFGKAPSSRVRKRGHCRSPSSCTRASTSHTGTAAVELRTRR